MEVSNWLAGNWLDLAQTLGIVGGLVFTAHAIRRDERGRQITNMLAVSEQSTSIWTKLSERSQLSRILETDVDLTKQPVSDEEWAFVKTLLLHLDTVRRAIEAGLFTEIKGLKSDIRFFLALPIPKAVWMKIKPFQDEDFVTFVENYLNEK